MFHNKKFKLIHFFLQKGKLLQKNPVILSVLVFLPTRSILNYSVFCMLIFCKNQCRCSLSAERSHYVELLSVITKIWNLISGKRGGCSACLAFGISLNCNRLCTVSRIFTQSVRTSAETNSRSAMCNCMQTSFKFWAFILFLSCWVKEKLCNVFPLNAVGPTPWHVALGLNRGNTSHLLCGISGVFFPERTMHRENHLPYSDTSLAIAGIS